MFNIPYQDESVLDKSKFLTQAGGLLKLYARPCVSKVVNVTDRDSTR